MSTMRVLLWMIFLCSQSYSTQASKVLFLPMMGRSPYFVTKAVADEMASRDHKVLILLPDTSESENKGQPNLEFYPANDYLLGVANKSIGIDYSKTGIIEKFRFLANMQVQYCESLVQAKETIAKIRDYDVVVGSTPFICAGIIAELIGKPHVSMNPGGGLGLFTAFGVNSPSAYVPQFQSRLGRKMNFFQRIKNMFMSVASQGLFSMMWLSPHDELIARHKISKRTISEILQKTELLLSQTDFAIDAAQLIPPRLKVIGPILPSPPKALPEDIAQFMDSASKEGVIIVSFGTVEMGAQTRSMLDAMARAFTRMPLKVLWKKKYEKGDENMATAPNIKILPWIPQNDLLGHPNTKVFITHVGMNGMLEGTYHGVPMVTCPQFGDQADNSKRVLDNGYGVEVDVYDTEHLEENLLSAVKRLTTEESFREHAQRASLIIRSRRVTPREEAADWIEHVIAVGDMSHLKPGGDSMPFYQVYLLDILAFFIVCFIAVFYILKCLLGKLIGSSKVVKNKTQ